jgi:nitrogenase molybdenum-iron protein alpha/beta subunit
MEEPLIRDIPAIKKNLELVRGMKSLKAIMPLLKPVLRLLGLKVDGVSDALSQVPELERMAEELATIPDRFKRHFRGTRLDNL